MITRRRDEAKSWTYLALAAGVAVVITAAILYIFLRTPSGPDFLRIRTTQYFESIGGRKLYEAYDFESIAGKLPLARYDTAVSEHFSLAREPRFKSITINSVLISGKDAELQFKYDVTYGDSQRTELVEGVMKFRLYGKDWKKEPEEYLQKTLEAYEKDAENQQPE